MSKEVCESGLLRTSSALRMRLRIAIAWQHRHRICQNLETV